MKPDFYTLLRLAAGREELLSELMFTAMMELAKGEPVEERDRRFALLQTAAAGRFGLKRETVDWWLEDCHRRCKDDREAFMAQAAQQLDKVITPAGERRFVPLVEVRPKEAEYLIEPYLPKGMITIIGGTSGMGKTWLALSWAAAISRGKLPDCQCPFDEPPAPGYVYYMTKENDLETVIVPRLLKMGADMSRIIAQRMEDTGLRLDDPVLDELAQKYPPALVIFDPIQSYLGAAVDMNKANAVRPVLDHLGAFAKRHGCAVVLISHLSKPSGTGSSTALDRLLGSSDFRNAARSIVIVGCDPDRPAYKVFAHAKNSIGEPGESQRFHIDGEKGLVYDGPCETAADEIVRQLPGPKTKPAVTLTSARRQLEELMKEGYAPLEAVEQLQEQSGISRMTLYRAKQELAVQTVAIGKPPHRQTYWLLPEMDAEQFRRDHTPPPKQLTLQNAERTS